MAWITWHGFLTLVRGTMGFGMLYIMIGIGHTFSKSEQRGVQPGVLTSALYNIKYKLYFYRECAKIKFRGIGIKIYIKKTTIKLTNPCHDKN